MKPNYMFGDNYEKASLKIQILGMEIRFYTWTDQTTQAGRRFAGVKGQVAKQTRTRDVKVKGQG